MDHNGLLGLFVVVGISELREEGYVDNLVKARVTGVNKCAFIGVLALVDDNASGIAWRN